MKRDERGGQRFEVGGWGVTRRDLQRLENWENRGKSQKELDPRPGLHAGPLCGVQAGFPGVIKPGIFFLRFISFVPRGTQLATVTFPPRWWCSGGSFRQTFAEGDTYEAPAWPDASLYYSFAESLCPMDQRVTVSRQWAQDLKETIMTRARLDIVGSHGEAQFGELSSHKGAENSWWGAELSEAVVLKRDGRRRWPRSQTASR